MYWYANCWSYCLLERVLHSATRLTSSQFSVKRRKPFLGIPTKVAYKLIVTKVLLWCSTWWLRKCHYFLDAPTYLWERLCFYHRPFVRPSFCLCIRPSVYLMVWQIENGRHWSKSLKMLQMGLRIMELEELQTNNASQGVLPLRVKYVTDTVKNNFHFITSL